MKKTLLITLMIVALLGAFTVSVAVSADAPAGDVEMKYPGEKTKYAPIKFSHAAHAAQACEDCHHKGMDDPKCTGCHSDYSKENKKNPESFDSAFHNKKSVHSCVGCHKKLGKDSPAPTKCNDCHTK